MIDDEVGRSLRSWSTTISPPTRRREAGGHPPVHARGAGPVARGGQGSAVRRPRRRSPPDEAVTPRHRPLRPLSDIVAEHAAGERQRRRRAPRPELGSPRRTAPLRRREGASSTPSPRPARRQAAPRRRFHLEVTSPAAAPPGGALRTPTVPRPGLAPAGRRRPHRHAVGSDWPTPLEAGCGPSRSLTCHRLTRLPRRPRPWRSPSWPTAVRQRADAPPGSARRAADRLPQAPTTPVTRQPRHGIQCSRRRRRSPRRGTAATPRPRRPRHRLRQAEPSSRSRGSEDALSARRPVSRIGGSSLALGALQVMQPDRLVRAPAPTCLPSIPPP